MAGELAGLGHHVTVMGSGPARAGAPYDYRKLPVVPSKRFERWPRVKPIRDAGTWESLAFMPGMLARFRPKDFDVTMTCGFPVENISLRRPRFGGRRPAHVFVTQNGDWPAQASTGEARLFGCDGLVCTNPIYFDRNQARWKCALIPNGADMARFTAGPATRAELGLPATGSIVLAVSALIDSKRVDAAIRAVVDLDATLVVAGDGPLRDEIGALGTRLLGDRFINRTFDHVQMPALYRSADVLLHTTRLESFGNIYVEAMATGLPVVAHDSLATRWILGASPSLVDTDDEQALTGALRAALRDGRDAGAEARIAAARERFSWRTIGVAYSEFLESVAEGRRRPEPG